MPKDSNIMFWTREELREEIKHLESENLLVREEADRYCRLWQESQAEVEEARRGSGAGMKAMLGLSDDLVEENTPLKAEVERLTERNKFLEQIDSYLQGANENAYEKRCDELEAENERLRKAGDAMADAIKWLPQTISDHHQQAWNAAKEGKQS